MAANAAWEREKWNRRYRDRGPEVSGIEPTPWLEEHRDLLAVFGGASALDLACGYGKNAFYLAQLGYQVEALDISDVAVDYLKVEAARRGLGSSFVARRANLRRVDLPEESYDVVVCFNFLERRLFGQIEKALRNGGLVFFETFTHLDRELAPRPLPPELTLAEGELRRSFPNLEVLACREARVERRKGPRAVASLVARRSS